MITSIDMDGNIIGINDFVGFKDDIEMSGRITAIEDGLITVSVFDSNTGERHSVHKRPRHLWLEEKAHVAAEEAGPLPATLTQPDAIFASQFSAYRSDKLGKCAALRAIAAGWKGKRKEFTDAAEKYGINKATAGTQWQHGRKE